MAFIDPELNKLGNESANLSGKYISLGDGLVEAANRLSLPIARWEWQHSSEQLSSNAQPEVWFEQAKKILDVEAIFCSPDHQILNGAVYLIETNNGWLVLQAGRERQLKTPEGQLLSLAESRAWRIVPLEKERLLSWRSLFKLGEQEGRIVTRLLWSTLIINLLAIVMPLYLNAIYDRIIPGHADASLWTLSIVVLLALAVEYVFRMERVKTGCHFLTSMQQRLEPGLIRALIHVTPTQDNRWGRNVLEAMNNWNRFRMQCLGLFSSSALDLAFCIIYFVAIAAIAGWLVLVPLFIFICAIIRVVVFHRESEKIPTIQAQVPFSTGMLENYQATVAYQNASLRFLCANEKAQQAEQARFIAQNRCSASLLALMNIQTVLAVIGAFYLVQLGGMSPAGLFATIIIAGRLGQPIFSLMHLLPNVQQMRRSMRETNRLLQERNQESDTNLMGYHGPQNGWGVSQLEFKYHSALPLVSQLNFNIGPKEKVAIVGGAGAGKSTVLKLLMGILSPVGGHVTWNGLLLSADTVNSMRNSVHYSWQDSDIIGDTLYEYLSLDNAITNNPEAILNILKRVNLTNLLPFLNQGLNTQWKNLAVPLTALQRQQMSLARLLLSQRKFCILDNPSAHLDAASELVLIEQLKERVEAGEGFLIATDRANLVSLADRVIMLSSGNVIFDGNRSDFSAFLQARRDN
ncbi:Alpha-hemolysin translocation ATP-binding protein HlyB [Pragia fontium]|uniref:ATP-binding cassette domain-containing protein n=1 Tax=Pragia fontium TaxID=82985 RepID=UPI000DFD0F2B|nr:ATP-binding cassette domain-containing protein [Pragia fontium]SUB81880.1 Alpha-hemolysin translocation ATP-binding protein HlyB [Pragia fontium]